MLVKMLFSLPTIDEQHGSKYYFGCQAMRNSGLEPECFKQTLEPESSASTNSASSAL